MPYESKEYCSGCHAYHWMSDGCPWVSGTSACLSREIDERNKIIHGAMQNCFDGMYLPRLNIKVASLLGTSFKKANLTGAFFSNMRLSFVDFTEANLEGVSFYNSVIENCNFTRANCARTFFTQVAFDPTPETQTLFDGTKFSYISADNLEKIFGNTDLSSAEFDTCLSCKETLPWQRMNTRYCTKCDERT